jgi:urease accessory protein
VRRGSKIRRAGEWIADEAIDCVILDAEDRHRRRVVLTGQKGTAFLLDLESPATLRDGDGVVLDDGSVVAVKGMPEPVIEIGGKSKFDVLRFAWHIGNRHAGLQIAGDKLRIRRDHVLEEMLCQMGANLTPIEAPFDPEPSSHLDHGPHEHGR